MHLTPINTALCAFGMSGKVFHGPFLHFHPGFHLYGVFERSKKSAQDVYPGIKSFSLPEEMLADDAIELVVVNTPNASHFDYARKALQAGKHVVVEKPFVTSVAQGNELAELAAAKGLKLAVYHNRRWDSDYLTVKQVVEEKRIGSVVEAEFHFDRFKQELSPKLHKEVPGPGSGIVFDLGSHIIDQALHLFGMPQKVFADVWAQRPISAVDDYFEILLYYADKRVRLKGGYQVKSPVPSYIIHGTDGSFLKQRGDVQEPSLIAGLYSNQPAWGVEPKELSGTLSAIENGVEINEIIPTLAGNYTQYFDQLYDSIRHNGQEPVTAAEGIQVIKIIEAAFASSREGKQVML